MNNLNLIGYQSIIFKQHAYNYLLATYVQLTFKPSFTSYSSILHFCSQTGLKTYNTCLILYSLKEVFRLVRQNLIIFKKYEAKIPLPVGSG